MNAPAGRRAPRRRIAFETVGSTNARALEAAAAGDPGPLWVTAEQQSEGRGRRGRSWESPAGNLYASLLVVEPSPAGQLSNLPLVVAVGVRMGLASLPGIDKRAVRIKWPNDILIDGGKCVGILIESQRLANGLNAVVIGCGVNVEHKPGDAPYKVASLREAGFEGALDEAFAALAHGIETALKLWDRGRGFAAVRREWIAASHGIGDACTVNLVDRQVTGRFVELDAEGRLVLETGDGRRETFSAGDLFFPARQGA